MAHRTALVLSIILTLVLAAGIVAGRERLFMAGAPAGTPDLTQAPAVSTDGALAEAATSGKAVISAAPRVIEIRLPSTDRGDGPRQSGEDTRWEDDDHADDEGHDDDDDHERFDDADEHEEELDG